MKGIILDYNIKENRGLILADDGKRYSFENSQWRSHQAPSINLKVDFLIDGENAKEIYIDVSMNLQKFDFLFNIQENAIKIANAGVQNTAGFIISLLLASSLFLPVMDLSLTDKYNIASAVVLDSAWGKIAFLLLILLSALFYSGAKRILIKIFTVLVIAIVILALFDLYSSADDMSRFIRVLGIQKYLFSIGLTFILPLSLSLIIVSFKLKYNEEGGNERIEEPNKLKQGQKSTLIAYLLWLFLGFFGAHRFYLKNKNAYIMLTITTLSMIALFFTPIRNIGSFGLTIIQFWWIFDAIFLHKWVNNYNFEPNDSLQN